MFAGAVVPSGVPKVCHCLQLQARHERNICLGLKEGDLRKGPLEHKVLNQMHLEAMRILFLAAIL